MMRPATIFLGQRRRGDGLARAEEGSGEESARASAFLFEKIDGYPQEKFACGKSLCRAAYFTGRCLSLISSGILTITI